MKSTEKAKSNLPSEAVLTEPVAAAPQRGGVIPKDRGFTLIELIMVCAVVVVLTAIAIPSYTNLVNVAKVSRCKEEIRSIEKAIDAFQADRGFLPPDDNGLVPTSLFGDGHNNARDPWGHPYQYRPATSATGTRYMDFTGVNPLNDDYDLFSVGEDGTVSYNTSDPASKNNVVRGANGSYDGLASDY